MRLLLPLLVFALFSSGRAESRFYAGVNGGVLVVRGFAAEQGKMSDIPGFQVPEGADPWIIRRTADEDEVSAMFGWAGVRLWRFIGLEAGGFVSQSFSRDIEYNKQLPPFFFHPSPRFFRTREEFKLSGINASLVFTWPVTSRLSLKGKMGCSWTKTKARFIYQLVTAVPPDIYSAEATDQSLRTSMTVAYRFAKNIALEAMWEPLRDNGTVFQDQRADINYFGVGLSAHF
jgi:hypothetical protein